MNTQNELATQPGVPQWTEIGQRTGLDPLAMLRPSEALYQSLLPGISTITLRLRYYSFFPWILDYYARNVAHSGSDVWLSFQRRSELLFALVSMHEGLSSSETQSETGASGAKWASRALKEQGNTILFAIGAEYTSDENDRYLKNKGGALGGIYGPQLRAMGLIQIAANHTIPVVTPRGALLAKALSAELGQAEDRFFEIVGKGTVTREELVKLARLRPSNIRVGSDEQIALTEVLFGTGEKAKNEDKSRCMSLLQLLELARQKAELPTSDLAKWVWYGFTKESKLLPPNHPELSSSFKLWKLYQTNDLLRLAYEALLKRAIDLLSHESSTLSLGELAQAIVQDSDVGDQTWEQWQTDLTAAQTSPQPEHGLAQRLEARGNPNVFTEPETVEAAFSLIAHVRAQSNSMAELIQENFGGTGHFLSLATERQYWASIDKLPAESAAVHLIIDRILKRHLWVASRKLRNQKAYTYLFDVTEGRLRHRYSFTVALSSPRLTQALTFLCDAGLLSKGGLTKTGHQILEAP